MHWASLRPLFCARRASSPNGPTAVWIFRNAGFDPAQMGWLWEPPWFLVRHGVAVAIGLVALLALLEWFGRDWPRYRRVTLGVLVWLANGTVFFGLTALLILILLAAPLLQRGP